MGIVRADLGFLKEGELNPVSSQPLKKGLRDTALRSHRLSLVFELLKSKV